MLFTTTCCALLPATGFAGLYCEGTQQAQVLGQQSHGYLDPGQWSYFALTLSRRDLRWQGGLAVAFLTTGQGYPVVLQKYGGVPTLLNNDRVLRRDAHAAASVLIGCYGPAALSQMNVPRVAVVPLGYHLVIPGLSP